MKYAKLACLTNVLNSDVCSLTGNDETAKDTCVAQRFRAV